MKIIGGKYTYLLLIISLVFANIAFAQKKSKLKNVHLNIKDKKVIVNYDIKNSEEVDNKINLLFYDEDFNYIYPKALSGDFGTGVKSGEKKQIVWDVSKDISELSSSLKPMVILNGQDKRRYGGSVNAWYSVIVPGLGDCFVADQSQIKFKPYMRTVASWGLIGLGIHAINQRSNPLITTVRSGAADPNQTVSYPGPTEYWAFQIDGELFLTLGVGVWVYDIIWVAMRGKKNQEYKSRIDGLSFLDTNTGSYQYGITISLNGK